MLLGVLPSGYGLDWKNLHEAADKIDISQAVSAVEKSPDSVNDLYVLALVYLNVHQDNEAESAFVKIAKLSPEVVEAQWGLAEVYRRKHNVHDAETMLEAVVVSHPRFAPAHISLGYIKYNKMEFERAVSLASEVIRQGKDNVDLSNYVRAYLLTAGSKGMIAHYGGPLSKLINGTSVLSTLKKAESLQPDAAAVLFGLGSFYLLAPSLAGGNLQKAQVYLEKALHADPGFVDIYVRLAQVYQRKGDSAQYEQYLGKALAIDPQNELVLDIKSNTCKFVCAAD